MKISTLLLTAVIAMGAGISGSAMADGDYGRGYGRAHGPGDYGRHEVYRRGHGHGYAHGHHKQRHWRYSDRHHPPHYWRPPVYRDSGYGIQLFYYGH